MRAKSVGRINNIMLLVQLLLESFEMSRDEVRALRPRITELLDALEGEANG